MHCLPGLVVCLRASSTPAATQRGEEADSTSQQSFRHPEASSAPPLTYSRRRRKPGKVVLPQSRAYEREGVRDSQRKTEKTERKGRGGDRKGRRKKQKFCWTSSGKATSVANENKDLKASVSIWDSGPLRLVSTHTPPHPSHQMNQIPYGGIETSFIWVTRPKTGQLVK